MKISSNAVSILSCDYPELKKLDTFFFCLLLITVALFAYHIRLLFSFDYVDKVWHP